MTRIPEHQLTDDPGQALTRRLQVIDAHAAKPARRRISVLYVEDDADDIYLLSYQMKSMPSFDVDFTCAATPAEARYEIAQKAYDVILCDFWLGSETTIPLIGELKSAANATPIILVSSLENDDIELIGRRAGADGFVSKGDLTSASLDRVFFSLLTGGQPGQVGRVGKGVADWLKALLRSLDRVHAASSLALVESDTEAGRVQDFLSEIIGNSDEIRNDIMNKLAGLERATRQGSSSERFDAVPFVADAIRKQQLRCRGAAALDFMVPLMPILIENSPTLFGDLIEGFFAEAGDRLERGQSIRVQMSITDGAMILELASDGHQPWVPGPDTKIEAAAIERRFLMETLARASGGDVTFASLSDDPDPHCLATLTVPLRLRETATDEA